MHELAGKNVEVKRATPKGSGTLARSQAWRGYEARPERGPLEPPGMRSQLQGWTAYGSPPGMMSAYGIAGYQVQTLHILKTEVKFCQVSTILPNHSWLSRLREMHCQFRHATKSLHLHTGTLRCVWGIWQQAADAALGRLPTWWLPIHNTPLAQSGKGRLRLPTCKAASFVGFGTCSAQQNSDFFWEATPV